MDSARVDKLSHAAYALLRLLELEAAWLPLLASTETKIRLAGCLGRAGEALGRLSGSLSELQPSAPSAAYAANFERACSLEAESDVFAFISTVSLDLQRALRAAAPDVAGLLEPVGPSADGPFHPIDAGGSAVAYAGTEKLPRLADRPARDPWFSRVPAFVPGGTFQDMARSREGMRTLLRHFYIDVEVPASEICARSILEYRTMPLEFKVDMAFQSADEAGHARVFRDRYFQLGGSDVPGVCTDVVWNSFMKGETLLERLAIEQVVQEGNGSDCAGLFPKQLRELGDPETAAILESVQKDEWTHCAIGNKWVMRLLNGDKDAYLRTADEAAAKIGASIPGACRPNRAARRAGGFPDWFIDVLEVRFEKRKRPA